MALHFLVEDSGSASTGDIVSLTGAEAKHAAVVRRLRVGESVTIGDGTGIWLDGEVTDVSAVLRSAGRCFAPPVAFSRVVERAKRDETG